eukprot:4006796-Heterocapsa_arctica.AAC.1
MSRAVVGAPWRRRRRCCSSPEEVVSATRGGCRPAARCRSSRLAACGFAPLCRSTPLLLTCRRRACLVGRAHGG